MKKMECPICKKKVLFVGVHDDEGNYHGLVGCEYENDPWSGLSYALHHEGWGDCPMCTDGAYSTMGGMLFDTAEDAISALSPPNEPLSPYPDGDMSIIACPHCGSGEYLHNEDGNEQNYCGQCGQAIDWSRPLEGEA